MVLAFAVGVAGGVLYWREPTAPLSPANLEAARARWRREDVRDYHVLYRMHGNLYSVTVQNGQVMRVFVNERVLETASLAAYSVDGLFDLLGQELENASDSSEADGTPADRVIRRVRFDRDLGYPERYLRGGGRNSRSTSLIVLRFEPLPAEASFPSPSHHP
jgi:hypothetical protein